MQSKPINKTITLIQTASNEGVNEYFGRLFVKEFSYLSFVCPILVCIGLAVPDIAFEISDLVRKSKSICTAKLMAAC